MSYVRRSQQCVDSRDRILPARNRFRPVPGLGVQRSKIEIFRPIIEIFRRLLFGILKPGAKFHLPISDKGSVDLEVDIQNVSLGSIFSNRFSDKSILDEILWKTVFCETSERLSPSITAHLTRSRIPYSLCNSMKGVV